MLLLVPVLLLVAFGFLALSWAERAEREELRSRCAAMVEPLRAELWEGLRGRSVLHLLPDAGPQIPEPGEESASLRYFREGDYAAVLGEARALSEAGLPLRPLAALRLLRNETEGSRLEELVEVILEEPCILTARMCREAEERFRGLSLPLPESLLNWEERIRLQENLIELLESAGGGLLAPAQDLRWIAQGEQMWLVLRVEEEVLLVSKESVSEEIAAAVAPLEPSLPAGLAISIPLRGGEDEPTLLQGNGVPPVRFVIVDPVSLRASWRERQRMVILFLVLAALLAVFGIAMIARTIGRERALTAHKSNLVAAVSHEMRTPVASIRLLAENLAEGVLADEEKRQQHLGRLVEQSERLSTLVENVLSYSRREAGKDQGDFEAFSSGDLFDEALKPFRVLAESQMVVVKVESARDVKGWGIREALVEAVVNLIDNALKHSPEGGEIICGIARSETQWMLWVEDEGPGVERSEQKKIFEAFYRVGSELRRETVGTGLGLALVKQVCDLHQGEVSCGERKGGGARFEMTLPLGPDES